MALECRFPGVGFHLKKTAVTTLRCHVSWSGLNWSLELYQQADARLHRQGQTHPVIIHYLAVEGGVDEDVMRALDKKIPRKKRYCRHLKRELRRPKQLNSEEEPNSFKTGPSNQMALPAS